MGRRPSVHQDAHGNASSLKMGQAQFINLCQDIGVAEPHGTRARGGGGVGRGGTCDGPFGGVCVCVGGLLAMQSSLTMGQAQFVRMLVCQFLNFKALKASAYRSEWHSIIII